MSKVWHLLGNLKTCTWLAMVTTIAVIGRILLWWGIFLLNRKRYEKPPA
jgi:hypothetical protein